MTDLVAENLNYLRQRVAGAVFSNSLLAELWQQVADGGGEVLRISPHRTVWKCSPSSTGSADADAWLLKVYHPRRSFEGARRLFRAAPAMREELNWRLLAQRLGIRFALAAEQIRSDVGMLARPFWSGTRVSDSLHLEGGSTGAAKGSSTGLIDGGLVQLSDDVGKKLAHGLGLLHQAHWTDNDLSASDLIFADDFKGMLLPLDLGHAKVSLLKPPAEAVYRDLEQLLASLPVTCGHRLAPTLLLAEHHGKWLKDYKPPTLVKRAIKRRCDHAWKRSRRCLRSVSDFESGDQSSRRRSCSSGPPELQTTTALKSGPRSALFHHQDLAWKFYPRSGVGQSMRKRARLGPGCQAFRRMYFLELLGLPVAPVQAWQAAENGEWLATMWLNGSAPAAEQLPMVAEYLARLHGLGVGLRDAKPQNFVCVAAADGALKLHLIDADGIRPELRNPWRDLARVIAETEAGSELELRCLKAYSQVRNVLAGNHLLEWPTAELQRLTAKDAEYFRGLLADQTDPT
jgi:hypothetical protein